jgi:hypothetical protein
MVEEFRDEYPKGEVLGLGFMGELLGGDASEPLSASRGVQVSQPFPCHSRSTSQIILC